MPNYSQHMSSELIHKQLCVTINMISRPIFIPFQLNTEMFAEGGDTMNNSLKGGFFFVTSQFHTYGLIIIFTFFQEPNLQND